VVVVVNEEKVLVGDREIIVKALTFMDWVRWQGKENKNTFESLIPLSVSKEDLEFLETVQATTEEVNAVIKAINVLNGWDKGGETK